MKQHLTHHIFEVVSEAAHQLGIPCYAIGGYVRDIFLKRDSKDVDIVAIGSGIDLAHEVANLLPNKPHVSFFKNFGTAMLKTDDGWEIEFVGARKESYNRNSRKPIVENGTLEDDQNRRDFTINALAISLNKESYGELLDPFNGIKDMEDKIIRTPLDPDITFSDDPLRMMRGIRFASQLGFTIEPETLQAIERNSERIKIVSMERISDELNKIILSKVPSVGFNYLFDTKLLHIIFPELAAMYGVEVINGKAHKDNFYHTLKVLDNICLETDDLWLRWSAILHDIAKPATKRFEPGHGWTFHGHEDRGARMVKPIFDRFKLPLNEKMRFVQKMVALHLRPIVLSQEVVTDSAVRRLIVDAGEDVDALITLCRADITSKNEIKVKKFLANLKIVQQKIIDVTERDNLRNFQPPVDGFDIMNTIDIQDKTQIGAIKAAVREAILDGEIKNDRQEAFDFMLATAAKMGLSIKPSPTT
ncbi:HD domain-containing protein [bacterium]|nr:MAG: HD domain-containing protein [bacterium]